MIDRRTDGKFPGVVGFFPTMSIEWSEPAVTIAGMAQAPVIELRPAAVEEPGGVT